MTLTATMEAIEAYLVRIEKGEVKPDHLPPCALKVLQATKDLRKVALWLGHANMQTTEIYTRADPSVKLEALDSIVPPKLRSGRFRATDKLIASLREGALMRSKKPYVQ